MTKQMTWPFWQMAHSLELKWQVYTSNMWPYGEWDNNIENDATRWRNIECARAAWREKELLTTDGGLLVGALWRRTWRSHWFKRGLRIVYTADWADNIVKWRLMCAPYNGTTVIFLQFFVRQIESFDFTSSVRSGGLSVGHSTLAWRSPSSF